MGTRGATEIGRAGEFLVAHRLQMAGINVSHVAQEFDLLCQMPSGRLISVEVKTCATPRQDRNTAAFHVKNMSADWLAAVWLPTATVLMFPEREVTRGFLRLQLPLFTEEAEAKSILAMLDEDAKYDPGDAG